MLLTSRLNVTPQAVQFSSALELKMISRILYFSLLVGVITGCVSINREDYKHSSPLQLGSGCPALGGTYYIEASKPLEPGSGYLLGSYAVIKLIASRDKNAFERWEKYFQTKSNVYDMPVEMTIAGDPRSEITISVSGRENADKFFDMKLSQAAKDYACSGGYLELKTISEKSYSHEFCNGYRSAQAAFVTAEDGSLVARKDQSFTGIVLIAPAHQVSRSWYLIRKRNN